MDTSETGRSLPIAKESSELPSNDLTGKISSILTSPASPTTLLQAAQSQSPIGHQPTPHNRESPAPAYTASPFSTFIPPSLESLLGATPIPKHTLQVNGTEDKNLIPEPVEQTTEMGPDHGKKITPEDKTLEITTEFDILTSTDPSDITLATLNASILLLNTRLSHIFSLFLECTATVVISLLGLPQYLSATNVLCTNDCKHTHRSQDGLL
jgi:hypothetical protein